MPTGNTLSDGAYSYARDEENRLTAITRLSDSALVGQYLYVALGRRIQKTADPAGTSTTTQYFYDAGRIIEEQNGGGVTLATYVYGVYVDDVLSMDRAGQSYYFHQNAQWSVEAVIDSSANLVERYSYDAYGSVTPADGSFVPLAANAWGTPHSAIGNPWMFTGRQLDEEDGLFFYRARYYDPGKGRFLERDPDEYSDSANLYSYTVDNPVNRLDPSGKTIEICCRGLNSGVGLGFAYGHCNLKWSPSFGLVRAPGWPDYAQGVRFGLYPEKNDNLGKIGVPRVNDPRDAGGTCESCGQKGACWYKKGRWTKLDREELECLLKAHKAYPVGEYSSTGPNSNTYAGTLARACCDKKPTDSPGSLKTPGWSDDPPAAKEGGD